MVSTVGRLRRLALPPIALALGWVGFATVAVEAGAASERLQLRDATDRVVERAERASLRGRQVPRARSAERREIPLLTPSPAKLRRAKARAAEDLAPSQMRAPQVLSPLPKASVFGGLNKLGMAAEGNRTPPDTTGAIGPSHYVEFVNGTGIAVYDRNLNAVSGPVSLEDFIGFPADAVFDPQIQWDQSWGRWIYVMDDIENPGTAEEENFLAFGWSKTADPSNLSTGEGGGWCGYFIETGEEFDDYPKLGHSDVGITIGTNVFTNEFITSRIWSIAKPLLPESCPSALTLSVGLFGSDAEPLLTEDGDVAFTPVPANTADSSANSYVVAADSFFFTLDSEIMAWHVSGAGETAELVPDGNIAVEGYEIPGNIPQPGTAERLDALDGRLTNAVAIDDPDAGQKAVWTQHTIEGEGRSKVRWYELLPATQTMRQEGEIVDPQHFVFNAAISPSTQGNAAAINFNRASATLFPEMRARSREASIPLGQMGGDVLLGTSAGAAEDFSCEIEEEEPEPCRWGDYAGASPDPVESELVWGSNQGLAAPQGEDARWTTRNFALSTEIPVPETTIDSGPPDSTDDTTPTFTFSSSSLSSTFECKVDSGAFSSCSSPFTSPALSEGPHTFEVRATDTGKTDPTPASRAFTVDSTPPAAPTIDGSDPASPANDNLPAFKGSAEVGSIVRLYRSSSCSGPAFAVGSAAAFGSGGLAVVVPDNQTTQVTATATDPAGNSSSCSGAFPYTEDSAPPAAPTITGTQPPSPANDNNPKVQGSAESGSTVRVYATGICSGLPAATGSAAAFGSPGLGVTVLDNRTTPLSATATDAVGNTSGCSSAFTYTERSTPLFGRLLRLRRVAPVRAGKALIPVRCVRGLLCRGVAKLFVRIRMRGARRSSAGDSRRRRGVRNVLIGRARFGMRAGRRRLLRVPLNRRGRRFVGRAGRRGVRAVFAGRRVANRAIRVKNTLRKRRRR